MQPGLSRPNTSKKVQPGPSRLNINRGTQPSRLGISKKIQPNKPGISKRVQPGPSRPKTNKKNATWA